jgi:threonine/homoserine/homoserine lactone efflux protein
MDAVTVLASIIAAIAVGAISPGPSFVLVSRMSLSTTRSHGLAAALGMGTGGLIFATLAVLGLTALLMKFEWLYFAFKFVGGAYLLYMAYGIFRGARQPIEATGISRGWSELSLARAFGVGLMTQLSNPKTSIFYASIFAAIMPPAPSLWLLLVLPPTLFLVEAGWYAIVALAFSGGRVRRVYARLKQWLDYTASAVMGALGAKLIMEAVQRKL